MSTTTPIPYLGEALLQRADFFQFDSILHPIAIGSIAIIFLFTYLRLSSNRTVAPLTIWDEICSIALGSTLAGIVNGQSLVKGLLGLAMLLAWQYGTSWLGCKFPKAGVVFTKPPLVVAFRGRMLEGVMNKHRINKGDLHGALRIAGVYNICELECVVVEPTGVFSIFRIKDLPEEHEPEVLLSIKGYRKLVEADEKDKKRQRETGSSDSSSREGQRPDFGSIAQENQGASKLFGDAKQFIKDKDGQTEQDRIADDAA